VVRLINDLLDITNTGYKNENFRLILSVNCKMWMDLETFSDCVWNIRESLKTQGFDVNFSDCRNTRI